MGWYVVRPARGQLWEELAVGGSVERRPRPGQKPRRAPRSVRRFVVVAVDGDVVTTADVDAWTWRWRVDLQAWSADKGDEAVAVEGPFETTTVDTLRHDKFVQIADPQNVHCDIAVMAPTQGVLLEFSGVPGGQPVAPSWTRCTGDAGSGPTSTTSTRS